MPFRVDGGRSAHGPGAFDMKASLVVCLAVLEQLEKHWVCPASADLGAFHFG